MTNTRGKWRGRRVVGGVAAALLVAAAAYGIFEYRATWHIAEVVPGRLYRSSQMNPERLARHAAAHGIATVIDFRDVGTGDDRPGEPRMREAVARERAAMEARGIRHVSVSSEQVPSPETLERFLATVETHEGPFLLHCRHGIGRTGLFTALFLIELEGYGNVAAHRNVSRHYSLRPRGRRNFRPDRAKGRFILTYTPRAGSPTATSNPPRDNTHGR